MTFDEWLDSHLETIGWTRASLSPIDMKNMRFAWDAALKHSKSGGGWAALEQAVTILGAMCEDENPGSEETYIALTRFLDKSGHEYIVNGDRSSAAMDIVAEMNKPHKPRTFPPRGPDTCTCADPENCTVPVRGCRAGLKRPSADT